jgi:hypothetical protein
MKHTNQINQEFAIHKMALKPQSLISPKLRNLTSHNESRIDPTTYEVIIKAIEAEMCHEQCPWLDRKKSTIPFCQLFNTQLKFMNNPTKQAFLHENCKHAILFLLKL